MATRVAGLAHQVSTHEPRSALVLLVPEADPVVGPVRLAHDPAASRGVAAHVTLLFPFVPAVRIDAALLARLAEQFARAPGIAGPIDLVFDRVARLPEVSYLAPADPSGVVAKVRALAAAWPEYPPYEGKYAEFIPHLTLAHGDDAVHAAVTAAMAPALPIAARVTAASLLVEDAAGRWSEHSRFALVGG
jgi:hypothetical protein